MDHKTSGGIRQERYLWLWLKSFTSSRAAIYLGYPSTSALLANPAIRRETHSSFSNVRIR